jgi:hypothetical protein
MMSPSLHDHGIEYLVYLLDEIVSVASAGFHEDEANLIWFPLLLRFLVVSRVSSAGRQGRYAAANFFSSTKASALMVC